MYIISLCTSRAGTLRIGGLKMADLENDGPKHNNTVKMTEPKMTDQTGVQA